jgi:large subunit ribosomal protein L34
VDVSPAMTQTEEVMHYPHRISKVKRARKLGFRARMKTSNGRKTINAKRRAGRKVQVV